MEIAAISTNKFTVSDLCDRYLITKQALYARMRAIKLKGKREKCLMRYNANQLRDLDLVESLLNLGYNLNYLKINFSQLKEFYLDPALSSIIADRRSRNWSKYNNYILDAFADSKILLTSKGVEYIFNIASTTVVKWCRLVYRNGYLLARWSKGTWRVYRWSNNMRCDIDLEYNLIHVNCHPHWFKPDSNQISTWEKRLYARNEEIRLRNKYGIPQNNTGEYRFMLSRREESE